MTSEQQQFPTCNSTSTAKPTDVPQKPITYSTRSLPCADQYAPRKMEYLLRPGDFLHPFATRIQVSELVRPTIHCDCQYIDPILIKMNIGELQESLCEFHPTGSINLELARFYNNSAHTSLIIILPLHILLFGLFVLFKFPRIYSNLESTTASSDRIIIMGLVNTRPSAWMWWSCCSYYS